MTTESTSEKSIAPFVRQSGFETFSLHEIKSGRNSRVYRIDGLDRQAVLKMYHRHPDDPRDRLGTEFAFLELLAGAPLVCAPRPLRRDDRLGLGLYEFLPGERVTQIGPSDLDQAVAFIQAINELRDSKAAKKLSLASEACRTIDDHVTLVSKRVFSLRGITVDQESLSLRKFIDNDLLPALNGITDQIYSAYDLSARRQPVSDQHWILSPSDFGFHNVLRAGHTLFFVDFEYAGWDDPAKLICDFSCQPERPITAEQAEHFSNTMATWLNSCDLMVRAENLTPLYRVKWCCILLNEYLQEGRDRRMHSNSSQLNLKEMQLSKAKRHFCQHLGSL